MSTKPKTVYATIQSKAGTDLRISGTLSAERAQVLVSTKTYHVGWFNLDRFEGGRLTASARGLTLTTS